MMLPPLPWLHLVLPALKLSEARVKAEADGAGFLSYFTSLNPGAGADV